MNPVGLAEAKKIASSVKRTMRGVKKTQVVVCPPYVYLSPLAGVRSDSLLLGSQDAFYEPSGSYTGEVSFAQLHQFGVSFVIIGHSERRKAGETDEMIHKKVCAVVGEGMTAILCVGENARDEHGEYMGFVKNQIVSGIKDVSKKMIDHVVIAYEPSWAIGGAKAMNPREVHEMYIFIKKVLHDMHGSLADGVRILYGASVMVDTAEAIVREGCVQGLLVGRDSLKPEEFSTIIKSIDAI